LIKGEQPEIPLTLPYRARDKLFFKGGIIGENHQTLNNSKIQIMPNYSKSNPKSKEQKTLNFDI